MTNIEIHEQDGKQTTNSKNVADVFGKEHRNVLKDIKNLECSEEFRALNFELSSYVSEQNKELPCVEITKDGFAFLCMGYRGKKAAQFKEAYISEFNKMADTLNSISNRINRLEIEGKEIKELGREWAQLGHEVNRAKKQHQDSTKALMSEVQLKLEI